MIKRIAVAAGIAALLATSAAAFAGSSITLSSTQLEQPKPVAVDGQWNVVDGLGVGMVAGTTSGTTASTVESTSTSDAGLAQTFNDGEGCQIVPCLADTSAVSEDDPRWDCHTMGNRVCGADGWGSYVEACHPELHTAVALRPVTAQQAADLLYLADLLVVRTSSLGWDAFRETANAYLLGLVSRAELIDPSVDTFPSLAC